HRACRVDRLRLQRVSRARGAPDPVAVRQDPGRQRREHPHRWPPRRTVCRCRPGQLGNLFQGRRSNTVHAVGHRAREPDQQVPVLEGRGTASGGRNRPGKQAMTRRFAILLAALAVPAGFAAAAYAAETVPGPAPQELIETTARKLLEALDADRALAKTDPARVRKLVDEILLPHFDTDYSARLVLGKHWRTATEEQRKRFISAFYQSLLRNYGSALAEFTADRMQVLPFRGDLSSGQASVRTQVKRSNG